MKRTSYLICTSPQCGAALFANVLMPACGAGTADEYFDPVREVAQRREFGAKRETFLDAVFKNRGQSGTPLGLIVQRQHWERFLEFLPAVGNLELERLQAGIGDVKYVWLRRGNKERQATAWFRKVVEKQKRTPGALEPDEVFDYLRVAELLRLIDKYERDWAAFFERNRIEPFTIWYEDLFFDWQNTVRELSKFLESTPVDASKFVPPSPPPFDDIDFSWLRQLASRRTGDVHKCCEVTSTDYIKRGGEHFSRRELSEAESYFRRALEWNPLSHGALHNCAATLAAQGKRDEAIRMFRRAVELRPDSHDTYRNLGLAYAQCGRTQEAEAAFRQAVDKAPTNADMHFELGQFLRSIHRIEEAVEAFRRAVAHHGDHHGAYYALGNCYAELKKGDEAKRALEQAIRIRPKFSEAHNNLGVLYEESGELDKAKQAYAAALAERPDWPEALNNYGVVLAGQGDYTGAEQQYRKALQSAPDSASVLNNLGNTLRSQGKLDEAVAVLRRSLELKPHYSEAYNNLGIALMNQGLPNEAIAHYNQALYFVPDYPEPHLNRSLAWLSLADFDNGWVEYEWRWRGKHFGARSYKQPRWDGGDLKGRSIFLYAEQGLGDTLQFIRYAKLVKQRGARVVAQVQSTLLPILASFDGVDEWIASDKPSPEKFDVHAPLLSLPGMFKTNADTIPATVPYLSPASELVEEWRERLKDVEGFRIGIAWQGNPQYRGDRMRSPALKNFQSLAEIPRVRLVSLQVKHGLDQLTDTERSFPVRVLEGLDENTGAFMDTAAVMKNLDLVIASDSAIVHLAGALGVPVWIPLPLAADWRWFRNREDSPWYPSARLFRQTKAGEWGDVFSRITAALKSRAASRQAAAAARNPLVTVASSFQQGTESAKAGKLAEAESLLRAALLEDAESAIVAHNLGVVLALQGKLTDAVELFRRAVSVAPEYGEAHGNLGLACLELGLTDEAIEQFQTAAKCGANPAAMHNNLGAAMMDAGRLSDAVGAYRKALLLSPNFAEAHFNLGRSLLALGNYEEGWLEFAWRRRCKGFRIRDLNLPAWAGEPLGGRSILIHDDAPAEDYFQFLRYASLIHQRGGKVFVMCPDSWAPLIRCVDGVERAVPHSERLTQFSVQSILSGLPGLFRTTLDSIPQNSPYLKLPEEIARRGAAGFDGAAAVKIALVRPPYDRTTQTADFSGLAPLLKSNRFQLVRIPVWNAHGGADGQPRPVRSEQDLGAPQETTSDLMMSAAWLQGADLVVTADGPECHLAGACGTRVQLLLDTVSNWRWMRNRRDTPWYPRTSLIRRHPHETQPAYFTRIVEEITRLAP